jgi:molybdopterin molybdotransferase
MKPGLMPVADALATMLADAQCLVDTETLPLYQASNRILAQDLEALVDVPPADNSAMDGYALRMADLDKPVIEISQRIAAGQAPTPLQKGTCARIFTGAETPAGAELVVMQEETEQVEGGIRIIGEHKAGAFIRRAGQDVQQGTQVLTHGTRLSARHLGVLASMGIAEVQVYRPLKVAVISTGSELVNPGESLAAGQIYNSNRYQMAGLLADLNMQFVDLGIVEDSAEATLKALQQAAEQADVVVTSGGVSVGEEDYVKASVEALGELKVWKLAIKPGKPLAYGRIGDTPFFGLPGNPASVLVTFMVIARPYLLTLQGAKDIHNRLQQAQLANPPAKPSVRQEYLRARITGFNDGVMQVEAMTNQNSGVLSTAMHGDGLAIVPIGACGAEAEQLEFLPF